MITVQKIEVKIKNDFLAGLKYLEFRNIDLKVEAIEMKQTE